MIIYPDSFEDKIGFATLRELVKQRCLTTLGHHYCDAMSFSENFNTVKARLEATAEMLSVITDQTSLFPIAEITDLNPMIKALKVPGAFIAPDDIGPLRHGLICMSELSDFFASHRDMETGESSVPRLDEIAYGLTGFPLLIAAIDRIIDRFGNIRDSASPELAEIRRHIQQVSGNIASTMRRVMASAASAGYTS